MTESRVRGGHIKSSGGVKARTRSRSGSIYKIKVEKTAAASIRPYKEKTFGKIVEQGVSVRSSGFSHAGLVLGFMDKSGLVDVSNVASHFGFSTAQLAETTGIRAETLYRSKRVVAAKTQNRVKEMLEIIGRISEWAGGPYQAMSWYRAEPLPAFGGRTAEALVKEGKAAAVRDYLDHVAMGGFV